MEKYYTPEIEEFYIGFEFEWFFAAKWNNTIYVENVFFPFGEYTLQEEINEKEIRVKYLDKEDLKRLTFNPTIDNEEIELSFQSKRFIGGPSVGDDYRIIILHSVKDQSTWIYKNYNSGGETDLFKGVIKNISELKKLLKQLQINLDK